MNGPAGAPNNHFRLIRRIPKEKKKEKHFLLKPNVAVLCYKNPLINDVTTQVQLQKALNCASFNYTCNLRNIKILRISPYSVRMRDNTDQKNSEYELFSRSEENWWNFTLGPN